MLIRKWEEKDNNTVALLEGQCFDDPWSYESICDTVRQKNFAGVVAESSEGEVIGYAGAVFAEEISDIALVAVKPTLRRKGVASAMLEGLFEELSEKGVTEVFLEVRVSNEGALALYEKEGFKKAALREKYYRDSEDAFLMVKVLPETTEGEKGKS